MGGGGGGALPRLRFRGRGAVQPQLPLAGRGAGIGKICGTEGALQLLQSRAT